MATQLSATTGATTLFGSNCQISAFIFWTPLCHGASFLFNLTILVLMLMKIREQREQPSNVLRRAYQDSLTLIAIATGASITVLIIHSLGPEYQLAKQVSLPFSTLITATMGARLFFILRIAPPVETGGRVPITTFQYATTVTKHVDGDKIAYTRGNPVPPPPPNNYNPDVKVSPTSSFTVLNSPPQKYYPPSSPSSDHSSLPHKYLQSPTPSSVGISPQPPYMSPQGPVPSISTSKPALRVAPSVPNDLQHNAYTTFPDPPSPPQNPITVRDGSIDAGTPLLKTQFNGPSQGARKLKVKKEEDYTKSGWVGAFTS
ncbi:hypothetical protein H0H87_005794 [Tephrocybe sp. NHM501043]|nr:hypothetical protein H0H87_005794 [Tephrocybe sp. NHM501043]